MSEAPASGKKRTFILGAGASVHAGGPLVRDLLTFDRKKTITLGQEVFNPLRELGLQVDRFNFEELLTEIDLRLVACTQGSLEGTRLRHARTRLVRHVQEKCAAVEDNGGTTLAFCKQLSSTDCVVTFNYDALIEDSLWALKRWDLCRGYGLGDLLEPVPGEEKYPVCAEYVVEVLKPHGSISWVARKGVDEGRIVVEATNYTFKRAMLRTAVRYRSRSVSVDSPEELMLAPSFIKPFAQANPFLRVVWHKAYKRMTETDELWITGYSIPEADVDAQLLLSALPETAAIRVVNPMAREVALRMQRLAPECRMAYNNMTFAELSAGDLSTLEPEGTIS